MDDYSSFMVIACESPTYTSDYFGFRDSRTIADREFSGIACIISGAYMSDNEVIRPAGLMQAWLAESTWLVPEAITVWLTERLHKIILIQESKLNDLFVESARRAGMKVMGKPSCVVCHGSGRAIRFVHWLNQRPSNQTTLLAFMEDDVSIDKEFIRQVRKGVDVYSMLNAFRTKGWLYSDHNVDCRDYCCLAIWLGGREDSDVVINTTLVDATAIKRQCCKIAMKLGITLYDAGSIKDLEQIGYFSLQRIYSKPSDLWKRIA